VEAYLEVRPIGWLLLQPDVQVLAERTPRGVRWSTAALLRVGVRY
ncbi:MAG: hypothetical protein GWM90_32540, partial [Gemmatimonadetes bacterium]|nr:hypothetical protein [Gemmatimonadota bacterium]NIQ60013.1 hypothetical protein [Gemmatimonadota bacterium]NIU80234.1 hypothetical protein [Gammaproteobacteria bacterium]NIX48617.1 hypothetical protein [Gemmatimonadota bacterium]NIY13064.1 hypothetical protein [Gemmatimonadota bacterium]